MGQCVHGRSRVNAIDLDEMLEEYRAGLEAEISLLHQLERLPTGGADMSPEGVAALTDIADRRDQVISSILSLEQHLRPLREGLADAREDLLGLPAFEHVAARHREAGDLVARLLASDSHSLEALRDAERARRFAADAVEKGETTLAAYRRVVAPPLDGARIVNRRG
jgi:hypothetical protein